MYSDYEQLLKDCPKYMNLEQMRIVCHISKKTARRLLQTGLVPCKKADKRTHAYKIKKTDIIKYLIQHEMTPEKYALRKVNYALAYAKAMSDADNSTLIPDNLVSLDEYPDVLSVSQAASLADVTSSAINDWATKKYLISFRKSGVRYIPKLSLVEYLQSLRHGFNGIWKQNQFAQQAEIEGES